MIAEPRSREHARRVPPAGIGFLVGKAGRVRGTYAYPSPVAWGVAPQGTRPRALGPATGLHTKPYGYVLPQEIRREVGKQTQIKQGEKT